MLLNVISFDDWTKAAELSRSNGPIPEVPSEMRSTPIRVACAVRVSVEAKVIATNIFSILVLIGITVKLANPAPLNHSPRSAEADTVLSRLHRNEKGAPKCPFEVLFLTSKQIKPALCGDELRGRDPSHRVP